MRYIVKFLALIGLVLAVISYILHQRKYFFIWILDLDFICCCVIAYIM